ncbi:PPOX class F420-dependent oxidoreductase [Streptomyces sp. NPDC048462]|uniref:PPOX class F420-dependent oxidoreductase n=1 Tax=Streptomyces sp. NPDC048462 TaxID=3365555 RepID=UPI0037194F7E
MRRRDRGRRDAAQWASNEYFALRTFCRDGSTVTVPIWLAPAGGRLFGYTPSRSWKVRRISRNSRVEVAASDVHGVPFGAWCPGLARILGRGESRAAKRALTAKYGRRFRFFRAVLLVSRPRRRGGRPVGLEITLDAGPSLPRQQRSPPT